jgi:hypothetical protein
MVQGFTSGLVGGATLSGNLAIAVLFGTVSTAVFFGIGRVVHIKEIDELFKKIRPSW